MKFKIENFRKVKSAEIDIDKKFTFIYGANGSGKSSIFNAMHSALTGETDFPELNKKETFKLVHDGAQKATVTAESQEFKSVCTWGGANPQSKIKGENPLMVHPCTSRLEPLKLSKKDFAKFFSELFKSEPTEEDLKKHIGNLCGDKFDSVWSMVKSQGWDLASKYYGDNATKQKGVWADIAGENYGSAKVDKWKPENWNPDLDGASEESLTAKLAEAEEFLLGCVAVNAVEDDEIERLTAESDKLQESQKLEQDLLSQIKSVETDLKKLGARPAELKNGDKGIPCPDCGTHLIISGKTLSVASVDMYTSADIEARLDEIKKYDAEKQNLSDKISSLNSELFGARGQIKSSESALEKLDEIKKTIMDGDKKNDLNRARNDKQNAEQDLEAFRQKRKADRAAMAVDYYDQLKKSLAPDGIRKEVLSEAIDSFNKTAEELFPEWVLSLDDELSACFNGRILSLCCESEKWRADAVLRAIVCHLSGSSLFMVDRFDILDNSQKNIFLKRMSKLNFKTVVFSTVENKSAIKKVSENISNTYYLEDCGSIKV